MKHTIIKYSNSEITLKEAKKIIDDLKSSSGNKKPIQDKMFKALISKIIELDKELEDYKEGRIKPFNEFKAYGD